MVEIGLSIRPARAKDDIANVVRAEREGFDRALYGDSQNAFADTWVRLGAAALATQRIGLAAICTPPGTRHPAVTASAAIAVQDLSAGRLVLGIGRGDSALGLIGRPYPERLDAYAKYVRAVQAYVRGESAVVEGHPSELLWRPSELAPPPIEIPCSGPKVIAFASTVADRVTFAVGAAPERVEAALEIGREAASSAGRSPESVQFGAFVNVAVSDDVELALEAMRGPCANQAKFSAMPGAPLWSQPPILRRVTDELRRMSIKGDLAAEKPAAADAEFVDWFGAVGPVSQVIDKLRRLTDLGLEHLYFLVGNVSEPAFTEDARGRVVQHVLPALAGR